MKKLIILIGLLLAFDCFSQTGLDTISNAESGTSVRSSLNAAIKHLDTLQSFVQNQISEIDSSWNAIQINNLQSKDSDSIIADSTIFFSNSIKIKTNTESFSVSKTISFANQHNVQMTITNNTAITITNVSGGSNPQLALIWSGGDYTASIYGATQMSGNTSISLQETNGATDLVQFKIINGTVYYSIINIVTP